MSSSKIKAYNDTVEIVKAAVGARESANLAADVAHSSTASYIQSVYEKLCEILEDAKTAED